MIRARASCIGAITVVISISPRLLLTSSSPHALEPTYIFRIEAGGEVRREREAEAAQREMRGRIWVGSVHAGHLAETRAAPAGEQSKGTNSYEARHDDEGSQGVEGQRRRAWGRDEEESGGCQTVPDHVRGRLLTHCSSPAAYPSPSPCATSNGFACCASAAASRRWCLRSSLSSRF